MRVPKSGRLGGHRQFDQPVLPRAGKIRTERCREPPWSWLEYCGCSLTALCTATCTTPFSAAPGARRRVAARSAAFRGSRRRSVTPTLRGGPMHAQRACRRLGASYVAVAGAVVFGLTGFANSAAAAADANPNSAVVSRIVDRWLPITSQLRIDANVWRAQFSSILSLASANTPAEIRTMTPTN